ncbi:hypothetical protein PLUA15_460043 [Pseudomonas lundensis]|uniref:Uncharacterized protein n=1 Tax=Pseudomonas lundensis TaxID=86185 RepID=A0AAX2HAK6_9PSED|nr:hypothetical protein PLUA15_460043 [Pseudomonas lundensis]
MRACPGGSEIVEKTQEEVVQGRWLNVSNQAEALPNEAIYCRPDVPRPDRAIESIADLYYRVGGGGTLSLIYAAFA